MKNRCYLNKISVDLAILIPSSPRSGGVAQFFPIFGDGATADADVEFVEFFFECFVAMRILAIFFLD